MVDYTLKNAAQSVVPHESPRHSAFFSMHAKLPGANGANTERPCQRPAPKARSRLHWLAAQEKFYNRHCRSEGIIMSKLNPQKTESPARAAAAPSPSFAGHAGGCPACTEGREFALRCKQFDHLFFCFHLHIASCHSCCSVECSPDTVAYIAWGSQATRTHAFISFE